MKWTMCALMATALGLTVLALAALSAERADAHHESQLPSALERNVRVKKLYPDLYKREASRAHPRWPRLTTMARTRWMHEHACDPRTLTQRYRLGQWAWRLVEKRWRCEGVPAWKRSFLYCIASHEGGHGDPSVWYGGSTGWQGGRFVGSDRVLGYLQVRPYWASLIHPQVTDRTVTWETYSILTNPVSQADIGAQLAPSNYATTGMCS